MWLAVLGVWAAVISACSLLKQLSWSKSMCLKLSRSLGLQFSFVQIRCRGGCLNRWINNIAPHVARVLRWWFNCGACLGIVLMCVSPLLLCGSLLGFRVVTVPSWLTTYPNTTADILLPSFGETGDSQVLHALIPGVTIPGFHIVYLFFVLLLSGSFHELGHALSAGSESVRLEASGFFLFVIYPGAFVELHSGLLAVVRPWQQLRIYCAGIWHNTVIAVIAYALLVGLTGIMAPLYVTRSGVVVADIDSGSALAGSLHPGDAITRVGVDCPVTRIADLGVCLERLYDSYAGGVRGYCVPTEVVAKRNTAESVWRTDGVVQCCNSPHAGEDPEDVTRLCFVRAGAVNNSALSTEDVACFAARMAFNHIDQRCTSDSDCSHLARCYNLAEETSADRLIVLRRRNRDDVLFLGAVWRIFSHITLSDFLPVDRSFPLMLPVHAITLLRYMLSVSAALAVLNILPAFHLDGQFALVALLEIVLPYEYFTGRTRHRIGHAILWLNSLLLLAVVFIALLRSL